MAKKATVKGAKSTKGAKKATTAKKATKPAAKKAAAKVPATGACLS